MLQLTPRMLQLTPISNTNLNTQITEAMKTKRNQHVQEKQSTSLNPTAGK